MPLGIATLIAGALGIFVGCWATAAFLSTERARNRTTAVQGGEAEISTDLLRALPQDFIILDREMTVEEASTRAYAYGIVRNQRVVREQFLEGIEHVRTTGTIYSGEIVMSRSVLSEEVETRLTARFAPISAGKILILFEDNTAALRLEEMRRDFTANVSHELKTPIGAMSLLAETIESSAEDTEAVRHFTHALKGEINRLSTLVLDIIELSRLQAGDALHTSELVDIDAVVADAASRMDIEAGRRHITITTGGASGLCVYGDAALLTTAVRNLLDNAVRYSHEYSRVNVGVSEADGLVHIAVVDQGEGIPVAVRERVFERFYRGDTARSRDSGGSGLGLAIVKHVAADHGGRVKLWSAPGRGSTFTILLPQARPTDSAPRRADGRFDADRALESARNTPEGEKDEPSLKRQALQHRLTASHNENTQSE